MIVSEKCPACQKEVEILLENARRENECPSCGNKFIPRHAINPSGFHAGKPMFGSYEGISFFIVVLIIVGGIISLFVSLLLGVCLLVAAAVIFLLKEIALKKK